MAKPIYKRQAYGRRTVARRITRQRVQEEIRRDKEAEVTPILPKVPLISPLDFAQDDAPWAETTTGPHQYRAEYANIAKEMCRLGATDAEVARALGVSHLTLWRWQALHEEFFRAMIVAGEFPDERVVRGLYHRAVGYSYPEINIMQYKGAPVVVPYMKHVPPDPNAAAAWLKKRRPEEWGDKMQHVVSTDESFINLWRMISEGQLYKTVEQTDEDAAEANSTEAVGDDELS